MDNKMIARPAGYKTPWEKIRPYIYVAPAIVFLLIFCIYPVFDVIFRSFQKWDMINKPSFVGLSNYKYIFGRKEFHDAVLHTVTYAVFVVILGLGLGTLFAVWLSKSTFMNNLTRTVMFMPHVISLMSVAMVWAWIMNKDNGLLNLVFTKLGLPALKWADSSDTAMMSIIIVALWKAIGYNTMLIYAAIQNVPQELYEAAELDSAGPFRKFFKITFPMISPQMFMLLITATTGSFKVFDTVRIMTHGGPGTSTQVLVYYIYKQAFILSGKVGYAFAAATVLLMIVAVLTVVYFKALSNKVHYQ